MQPNANGILMSQVHEEVHYEVLGISLFAQVLTENVIPFWV